MSRADLFLIAAVNMVTKLDWVALHIQFSHHNPCVAFSNYSVFIVLFSLFSLYSIVYMCLSLKLFYMSALIHLN